MVIASVVRVSTFCLSALQASRSIERYGVHAVVANILETRKEVVILVRKFAPSAKGVVRTATDKICRRDADDFIEGPLVERLVELHRWHIAADTAAGL